MCSTLWQWKGRNSLKKRRQRIQLIGYQDLKSTLLTLLCLNGLYSIPICLLVLDLRAQTAIPKIVVYSMVIILNCLLNSSEALYDLHWFTMTDHNWTWFIGLLFHIDRFYSKILWLIVSNLIVQAITLKMTRFTRVPTQVWLLAAFEILYCLQCFILINIVMYCYIQL